MKPRKIEGGEREPEGRGPAVLRAWQRGWIENTIRKARGRRSLSDRLTGSLIKGSLWVKPKILASLSATGSEKLF